MQLQPFPKEAAGRPEVAQMWEAASLWIGEFSLALIASVHATQVENITDIFNL
ncbi:hypothetical protein AmaxDRAFT_0350 [Limnospira maxima CS-328]|uniref:Uncharacterized protein n=1 Tax=Limnospira maxima CS-328 TaxID=513049 RepID=B5VV10_LIMMA|nr:hypothetical protein AmaxDRAFT_0350 [Limnospira maxima CS-328]UWU50017.1 hypothetical protein APLC1_4898 [Arthrospira platensis C1]